MQKNPVLLTLGERQCCSQHQRHLPFAQPTRPPAISTPIFNTAPTTVSKHPSWCTPGLYFFHIHHHPLQNHPLRKMHPFTLPPLTLPTPLGFHPWGFPPLLSLPGEDDGTERWILPNGSASLPFPEGTSASATAPRNPQPVRCHLLRRRHLLSDKTQCFPLMQQRCDSQLLAAALLSLFPLPNPLLAGPSQEGWNKKKQH